MTRGRKPKHSHLKAVQGNAGKRAINHDEPQAASLTEVPLPPDWLSPIGIAMWERIAPWLVSSKILTDSDLANLEAYCAAYSRWRQAEEDIAGGGWSSTKPCGRANPTVYSSNAAPKPQPARAFRPCETQLGPAEVSPSGGAFQSHVQASPVRFFLVAATTSPGAYVPRECLPRCKLCRGRPADAHGDAALAPLLLALFVRRNK